ncbi:MAG: UTP--glucose-1-phosphate uridylyltransferase, partial [Elusimicrobiota bacterium]
GGVVKGIIDVYDNKSFLQIKLEQIKRTSQKYGIKIPIFLMNSFATSAPTIEYLEKNKYFGLRPDEIHIFDQFIFKRLNPDGSEFEPGNKNTPSRPCTQERDTPFEKRGINTPDCNEKYYGPGHGDFPYAFRQSGLLDAFLKNSGKYVWFSNVDNLGATINEIILGAHIKSGAEMTAELAEKYPGDKGGAPALVNGKLQIVEQFKFPVSFNQNLINVFNSATYIFTAEALKRDFNLPYYVVKKEVAGKKVIQFERLAGDLSIYLKANYVIVEREKRFIPIKTQEDLSRHREFFKKKFG